MTMSEPVTADWVEAWVQYLQSADTEDEVCEAFIQRWHSKTPSRTPGLLYPSENADPEQDWSLWLEEFLLTKTDEAEFCAKVLVTAIEKAFQTGTWKVGNIVWMRDVLALRRIAYADNDVRLRAARVIIQTLGQLVGVSARSTEAHYAHFDALLELASKAMVAELYESNFVEGWCSSRMSVAGFDAFSLMWHLESARRHQSELQGADTELEDKANNREMRAALIDDVWHPIVSEYQALADGLFETLVWVNSQSMLFEKPIDNRREFLVVLGKIAAVSNSAINDYARFLGFQRKLDIHWVRFSVIVSRKHRADALLVRKFVSFMVSCDGVLRTQVRRSVLLKGLKSALMPKIDPLEGPTVVSLSYGEQGAGKLVVPKNKKLEDLSATVPEIAEVLAEEAE